MLQNKNREAKSNNEEPRDQNWHSFLITSHQDRSIVLSTEETLQEINTDFFIKVTLVCLNCNSYSKLPLEQLVSFCYSPTPFDGLRKTERKFEKCG